MAIDEEWVNPYAVGENTVLSFVVKREDYVPYAVGTYYDYFLYGPEQPYEQVLQYSPATDTYRIPDCWYMGGGSVVFTWKKDTEINVTSKTIKTGYNHPTYGMISANYLNDYCYAEVAGNMVQMVFYINFTVSAGTFGDYPNVFVFEKPE